MNDGIISIEGVNIAEVYVYIELFRAYSEGIYMTTAAYETCRYEKSF